MVKCKHRVQCRGLNNDEWDSHVETNIEILHPGFGLMAIEIDQPAIMISSTVLGATVALFAGLVAAASTQWRDRFPRWSPGVHRLRPG